jgi:hypothetical protein
MATEQEIAQWRMLKIFRISLLVGWVVLTIAGAARPQMTSNRVLATIHIGFLVLALIIGIWERTTGKRAGIEPRLF